MVSLILTNTWNFKFKALTLSIISLAISKLLKMINNSSKVIKNCLELLKFIFKNKVKIKENRNHLLHAS